MGSFLDTNKPKLMVSGGKKVDYRVLGGRREAAQN